MTLSNIKILNILFFIIVFYAKLSSQTVLTHDFVFPKTKTINVSAVKTDWFASLTNKEEKIEGNQIYKAYLKQLKIDIEKKYPRRNQKSLVNQNIFTNDTPKVIKGFASNEFNNAVPNDNTLAVSNDGMLISGKNSNLYMFDVKNDTLLKKISLTAFTDTLKVINNLYDPKLVYDPEADRFIIVYLSGANDSTSNIVVGFSNTNDPTKTWNLYAIPGNPLNDTSWSDFPAIAITHNELFITMNLLMNAESWQNSFKQSIVWQVDKSNGYEGKPIVTKLWNNINFNNKPIRNLFPVQGGKEITGPNLYFLSNRNFAIQNDTIFIVQITNKQGSNPVLKVNYMLAEKNYGAPPSAIQPRKCTLQTNDARVLGGIITNNKIQFVSNTIDTSSGKAAIYHGIIKDVTNLNQKIYSNIITDKVFDFGYPNISYTGSADDEDYSMISFNYTSANDYPGFCALFFQKENTYSKIVRLKSGEFSMNYSDKNERWGDYSGSQRKWNEPGKVWVSGCYGIKFIKNYFTYSVGATWVSELENPFIKKEIPAELPLQFNALAFPNPSNDYVNVNFNLPEQKIIKITLYNNDRKLVKLLYEGISDAGKNVLRFSTAPLRAGLYFLYIQDNNKNIYFQKIVVNKN